jgi:hypothetical protein
MRFIVDRRQSHNYKGNQETGDDEMTKAIETISAELATVFADLEVRLLADAKAWAHARVAALAAFKAGDEYQAICRDAWKLYPRLFAIAGGKTWYTAFSGRNAAMIDELMTKNCAAIAALAKAGVNEVVSREIEITRDGFNGVFFVGTDQGKKRVKIQTIYAGGYNIQCAHMRVLVHVSK